MDPTTSLKSNNVAEGAQVQPGFNWHDSDTSFLAPNQLGISRVQRAWDRKPKTAFSHAGQRVGKVWKRAQSTTRANAMGEERHTKRRKGRCSSSPAASEGERKPVKKMCLDSGFGLAPRVLAWEGHESPTRKIRTRTSAAAEELDALPDDEEGEETESEDEGNVTVEILDEDGTVVDVNPAAGGEDAEWEDEDAEDGPAMEDEFNDTMRHLADIIGASEQSACSPPLQISAEDLALPEDIEDIPDIEQENQDPLLTQLPSALPESPPVLQPVAPIIPEGFVSPVRQPVQDPKNRRRSFGGPRRRTLPRQFAPSPLSQVMNAEESFHEPVEEQRLPSSPLVMMSNAASVHSPTSQVNGDGDGEVDAQWEDVDEVSPPPIAAEPEANEFDATSTPWSETRSFEPAESPSSPKHLEHLHTSNKLPSSPIPSIEGPHPRLPLRRSPRRKSSSPRKKSTILPPTEKPHLVAFTPVKGLTQPLLPPTELIERTDLPTAEELQDAPSSPLERSASTPPEEPQISPRKPVRPRVSDDTALLQAFLNRAAENKGSRRMSAAKRESITNRRDSDSVRQALGQAVASPAKTDVLGELDVNSPSPRKTLSSAGAAAMDTSAAFDEVINEAAKAAQHDVDVGDETSVGQRTRRSGRGARRGPATPAAAAPAIGPNKIAIKGSASEGVVLKRSEAQEMALLTRNNTRKNKGGAILPPLRLTKMGSQLDNAESTDSAAAEKAEGTRGVTWAEQLVEYHQGGELSEASILSDELNGPAPDKMDVDSTAAAPPPASETPSKPKIRRLKAARTAGNSTPGKTAPPPEDEKEQERAQAPPSADAKPAGPATKRRSRIATPAKGLLNASLLPSDLDPQPVVPAAPAPAPAAKPAPAAATKKKTAPVSKLPAPASTTSLGQGKENLLTSPAKKKPSTAIAKNALPTAKTFAPKLDFNKAASLAPATGGLENVDAVPGLMSPAKKGGRTKSFFAAAKESESESGGGRAEVPGLMSPAKKRTRRAI